MKHLHMSLRNVQESIDILVTFSEENCHDFIAPSSLGFISFKL